MKKNQDIVNASIQHYQDGGLSLQDDLLCSEEPLEFRVPFMISESEIEYRTLAITMRTPGHDIDLARGFLYNEGVIKSADDINSYHYCDDRGEAGYRNSLQLSLKTPVPYESQLLERRFTTYFTLCG